MFNSRIAQVVLALAILAGAARARADLLVEPYLGYGYGSATTKFSAGGDSKYDMWGPSYGARLGWQGLLLFAALDGQLASGKGSAKTSGASDYDYSTTQLFADVGVRLPLIRVYAGYGFLSYETDKASGTSDTKTSGSAIKLGGSFTGLPLIAINLEYIMSTVDKIDFGSGYKSKSDYGYSEMSGSFYMLSVSVPLSF